MSIIDNSISPVEDFIKQGLAERFKQTFGTPLTYTTSTNKKAIRAKQLQSQSGYPMAFATLKSFAIDETRYSFKTLFTRGVSSQANTDSRLTYKVKPLPAILVYEITFIDNDSQSLANIAKSWLFAVATGSLKFSIMYGTVDMSIAIDLDREINFTDKKNELTETDEYEATATLRVFGFISPNTIQTQQAIVEVQLENVVGDEVAYSALADQNRGEHQAIFFRKWNDIAGPEGSADDPKSIGP